MKKILFFLALIVLPLASRAQISGLGTWASPYKGTLTSNLTWSGNVYVGGDIIISAWKLTINPGARIIFVTDTAGIIIRSTGQLEAKGTNAGGMFLFTANDDNDNNFGETGERWGHISFQNMGSAGASLIDSCIIEYGDVSSTSLPNRYGGAIHSAFTNLTISNCIIRNNKAGFGGGIFVNKNVSPTIYNCTIYNNTSTSSGGGLYFWSGTASVITNCLIFSNTSTSGGGGGGVFLGDLCGNVRFYNTTFANNAAGTNGKNIMLYVNTNPSRPSFRNCIVWSPANSIYYNSPQTPTTSDFINCAIQNPVAGSTTNCITLNALNTDPAGPNFTSTTDNYWFIAPWSPCVNAGLDNSSDPLVPLLDKIGRPRNGQTDIGAYETWGFFWIGEDVSNPDVWNNSLNWYSNSVPSGNEDIFIPGGLSNYPTSSMSQNYTIGAGRSMIMAPGAKATFGSLTNSGTLRLESDASNISSLITTSFSGNDAQVQLYLTGGYVRGDPYFEGRWHYISSPFANPLAITPFTAETYDLAQWVDGINSEGSILPGWVAFDGYTYDLDDPGGPYTGTGFSSLATGKGYNFWDNKLTNTYSLSGELNTDDVVVSLDFAGDTLYQGFNLLGNPFSAGLDWDYIIENTTFPDSTGYGIYFTHENVQYSYISGVANPEFGEPASSGIIPPMQGFFVKTYGSDNAITLSAAARVHTAPARYKGSGIFPLVRLSLTEDSVSSDQTVVRFDVKASAARDYNFDALKMFLSPAKTAIYSMMGTTKYSINGQPFPETFVEIPVVINLQNSGDHIIKATQIDDLDNYTITLKDNNTGFTADLRSTPELSFFADAGTITGRFILKISNIITGTENPSISDNTFNLYPGNNMINIQTISDEWDGRAGSVRIMDLSGRTFSNFGNAEFRKGSLIQVSAPAAKGMYVVELRSGVKRYVGKVVIR